MIQQTSLERAVATFPARPIQYDEAAKEGSRVSFDLPSIPSDGVGLSLAKNEAHSR